MSNPSFGRRGKHVTVQFSIGGQRYELQGVSNFNAKPRQSIDSFQPSGQNEEETDLNHKGYDVEYETRKSDGTADVVLDRIVARLANGLAREQLTVTATENFGATSQTYAYFEGDLMIEPIQYGSGDDPISAKWKFQMKKRRRVA